MDWWSAIPLDQRFTIYLAVFSALLGGVISLGASLVVFSVSKRNERIRAEEQQNAKRDRDARVGLAKLVGLANLLHSIDKTIDSQFREAHEQGILVQEPGLFVRQFIGAPSKVDWLNSDELEFLFFSGSGDLVTRIQLAQQRATSAFAVVEQYNREREAFSEFLMSAEVQLHEDSDALVAGTMDEQTGKVAEVKLASLNRLVGAMVEGIPDDLQMVLGVLDEYGEQAKKLFGEKFPTVKPMEQ